MKNKLTSKKLVIASLLASAFSITGVAHAAWEVNDQKVLTETQQMRQSMEKMLSGINDTIDTGNSMQNIRINQQDMHQQTTDARFRRALGETKTIDRDMGAMPTLAKCAELTRSKMLFGGGSASGGGGGGGTSAKGGGVSNIKTAKAPGAAAVVAEINKNSVLQEEKSIDPVTAITSGLNSKKDLGTCTAGSKIGKCTGAEGKFPGGDVNAAALFNNVDTSQLSNKTTVNVQGGTRTVLEPVNSSIDGAGVAVASQYIDNLIGVLPAKQSVGASIEYSSMWDSFVSRVSAIRAAGSNILKYKASDELSGALSKYWATEKDKYVAFFPKNKYPEQPSQEEFFNFFVLDQFAKALEAGEDTSPEAQIAKNTALNNYLLSHSLKKQEYTNLLLMGILAQSLNPVTQMDLKAARKDK